jgi:hypothetical protein
MRFTRWSSGEGSPATHIGSYSSAITSVPLGQGDVVRAAIPLELCSKPGSRWHRRRRVAAAVHVHVDMVSLVSSSSDSRRVLHSTEQDRIRSIALPPRPGRAAWRQCLRWTVNTTALERRVVAGRQRSTYWGSRRVSLCRALLGRNTCMLATECLSDSMLDFARCSPRV